MQLPVTREDIVSVKGRSLKMQALQRDADVRVTKRGDAVAYLTSEGGAQEKKGEPGGGLHHFCSMNDDVMLPDYYRGTWRKYHVPSKNDKFLRAVGVRSIVHSQYLVQCNIDVQKPVLRSSY